MRFVATILLLIGFVPGAMAAVFNPLPGTADGAPGSLRDAMITANGNGESDTINLTTGTYTLNIANAPNQENAAATGDLDLTEAGSSITIQGNGAANTFIDQTSLDRVFHILGNVTVELNGVTIQNGTAVDDGTPGSMPSVGDGNGGGILNDGGTLTLVGTTVTGNTAIGDGPTAGGGGIYQVSGSFSLESPAGQPTRIENNQAVGIEGSGGGIYMASGSGSMTGGFVDQNSANRAGGGIEIINGTFSGMQSCRIRNNDVNGTAGTPNPGNGGGIHTRSMSVVSLDNCLVSVNAAANNGGGLWNQHNATMTIIATRVNNNTAHGIGGGGIYNNGGSVDLLSGAGPATVNGNTTTGTTGAGHGGGVYNVNTGTVTLTGASNQRSNISGNNAAGFGGGVYSLGTFTMDTARILNNQTATAGGGGGIAQEGAGSLVTINDSDVNSNTAGFVGGGISIQGGATLTITDSVLTQNTSADDGGGIAVRNSGQPTTVELNGSVVSENIATLDGGGLHLDAMALLITSNNSRIDFNLAGRNGGGIFVESGVNGLNLGSTVIVNNEANGNGVTEGGGGIYNNGAALSFGANVTVTRNDALGTSGSGGGIFNNAGGTLTITGAEISRNTASRAGGGIEDQSGPGLGVTLDNVVMEFNSATTNPGNGGALHVTGSGDVSITTGSISQNTAASEGGGLWNGSGTMTLNNTSLSLNIASGDLADQGGGGIFNDGGTLSLSAGTMMLNNERNGDDGNGGGIHSRGGSVTLMDTNIENSTGEGIFVADGGTLEFNSSTSVTNTGEGIETDGAGTVVLDNSEVHGMLLRNTASLTTTTAIVTAGVMDAQTTGPIDIQTGGWSGTADVILSPGTLATIASGTNSSYTGTTLLTSGQTQIDGTLSPGGDPVTVGPGATLGGNGVINRTLNVDGVLEPGAFDVPPRNSKNSSLKSVVTTRAPGFFMSDDLNMSTGATFNVELNGLVAGVDYDQVNTGAINLDTDTMGGADLNVSVGYAAQPGDSFVIIESVDPTPVQGTFNGLEEGDLVLGDGVYLSISYVGGDGNDVELTYATPDVFYVSQVTGMRGGAPGISWDTAFSNPQDALAVALPGSEIWIAQGVYYPDQGMGQVNDDPTSTFNLIDNVDLYGGFNGTETARNQRDPAANITILSGDIDGDDIDLDTNFIAETVDDIQGQNAYHVMTLAAPTSSLNVDGFVVTAGDSTGAPEDRGGGLNCTGQHEVDLTNMTFIGNRAGRGSAYTRCISLVRDSSFINNRSNSTSGGGAFDGEFGNYDRVLFMGNRSGGPGAAVRQGNSPFVARRTAFIANESSIREGGALRTAGDVTLNDVLFLGNVADGDGGGAIITGTGNVSMTNVTMTGNRASGSGGALFLDSTGMHDVSNTISWNNQDAAGNGLSSAFMINGGNVLVSNSLIQNSGGSAAWNPAAGIDGGGNLDEDPRFVQATDPGTAPTSNGDARLDDGSVAENAGDNVFVTSSTDLDGEARIQNGTVDMGAYEGPVRLFEDSFEELDSP